MPDGHCPAMPQVTTVDDQFGTHTGRADATTRHMIMHRQPSIPITQDSGAGRLLEPPTPPDLVNETAGHRRATSFGAAHRPRETLNWQKPIEVLEKG